MWYISKVTLNLNLLEVELINSETDDIICLKFDSSEKQNIKDLDAIYDIINGMVDKKLNIILNERRMK